MPNPQEDGSRFFRIDQLEPGLWVRELGGEQTEIAVSLADDLDGKDGAAAVRAHAAIAALGLCDDSGNLIVPGQDGAQAAKVYLFRLLRQASERILELSGLGQDEDEGGAGGN